MIISITDKEYFGMPDMNQSTIKNILSMTPRSFVHSRTVPKKDTPATIFGTLVHCLLLEPKEVNQRYATFVFDDTVLEGKEYKNLKATKIYKEQYQKFIDENEGKQIVDTSVFDNAELAAGALRDDVSLLKMVGNEDVDTEMCVINQLYGSSCKAKLDFVRREHKLILDVKTTIDPLDDINLYRHLYKWDFPIQAAFYIDLMKAETGHDYTMFFAIVNSNPPFDTRVVVVNDRLTPDFLDAGRAKIVKGFKLLDIYAKDLDAFLHQTTFIPETIPTWYGRI